MKRFGIVCAALMLVLSVIGCGETEEKIEDIDKNSSDRAGTVSHKEKYEFDLDGDRNVYRLEDKIEEIEIVGDDNYITIVSDAMIDSLVITGSRNVVDAEDNHSVTIVDVEINGSNNVVRIYDAANITLDGSDNQVLESAAQ